MNYKKCADRRILVELLLLGYHGLAISRDDKGDVQIKRVAPQQHYIFQPEASALVDTWEDGGLPCMWPVDFYSFRKAPQETWSHARELDA